MAKKGNGKKSSAKSSQRGKKPCAAKGVKPPAKKALKVKRRYSGSELFKEPGSWTSTDDCRQAFKPLKPSRKSRK